MLQKIKSDHLESRKTNDSIKKNLLTTLIGEAEMVGKNDGNRSTTDSEVIAIVKKFLKNNLETQKFAAFKQLEALQAEEIILNSYLPKQLSVDEIKCILEATGITSKGEFMKYMKSEYSGLYDGLIVSKLL